MSIISANLNASFYLPNWPNDLFDTSLAACKSKYPSTVSVSPEPNLTTTGYCKSSYGGDLSSVAFKSSSCKADGTFVYSGSVTVSNWKDDAEYVSLTDQATVKFAGTYVCSNSCRFDYDFLAGDGDPENGPIVFKGRYSRTTTSCVSGDTSPNASITGSGKPKSECTKAYCDKEPNKSCPDGYSQGSFNGKQICVKNSPKNPNPNDPNTPYDPNNPPDNGGGDGKCNGTNNCNTNNYEFDVSQIVNAISSQTSAITSAISQQTSSLSSAISSAASSINSALSSGFSSLKSAIDSTTSAINSVKTAVDSNTAAVNANGTKVKDAVDSNTAAVNANGTKVKDAVDSNTAAVNANGTKVKDAVDSNTAAVNANGTKVKDAVDSNTAAVNANGTKVKDAVDSNTAAVNANGTKVKDAVDSNTAAVNANGEKLDELNQTAKDSKSLLQQIKDFFTEDHALPSDDSSVQVGEIQLPQYEENYVTWSQQCPPDVQVPISLMGQSSTLVMSWSPWCELLAKLRWAIIACAYFAAAYIILGMR